MSSALTSRSTPPIAGYIPPTLSDRIMDSTPASSSTPLAICASAADRNVDRGIRSEDVIVVPPSPTRSVNAGLGLEASLWLEAITKRHSFQFDSDSVRNGDHGARLEYKCRQHRAELVNGRRLIAIQHHVPAPVTDPNHEQLDLEIGRRLPLREHLQNPFLGVLVFNRRTLRAFRPGKHVFHGCLSVS